MENSKMVKPSHVLLIRLSALGDVAMIIPVLRVLTHSYPDLKITVLSRKQYKPLFAAFESINFLEADVYGKHKGLGLFRLAKEAKNSGIDAVADLHDVIRSKIITRYLKFKGIVTATIDKGRAEKGALTRTKNKEFNQLKTTHDRYAEVFGKIGLPILIEKSQALSPKRSLSPQLNALIGVEQKKLIGIAPFAAYESKMYDITQMEAVVASLDKADKYRIFLFGGEKKEVELLQIMAKKFENVSNIAGRFSFKEELDLISNLDLMVSMDSANGHLAAMYGVPVLTLWGVTHPYAGFAPFNQPESNQLMANREKYPLIPTSVYGNKFPKGYENVMDTIPAETVVSKIQEILRGQGLYTSS